MLFTDDPVAPVLQEWIMAFMHRSMHSLIHYIKKNDLSMSQIGALFQINHGKSNVSELGEGLGITIAAASQMLERLVQQELILRTEDPEDRRVKKLVLTEKGQRVVQEITRLRRGQLDALVDMMTDDEKKQIEAAVKILIEKTKQLNQHSHLEF